MYRGSELGPGRDVQHPNDRFLPSREAGRNSLSLGKKEVEVIGRGTSPASPQEVGQVILGVIITVITRHEG